MGLRSEVAVVLLVIFRFGLGGFFVYYSDADHIMAAGGGGGVVDTGRCGVDGGG